MEDFKVGDCVILVSNGPKMTVMETKNNAVNCVWFAEKHNVFEKWFYTATIKKISPVHVK